MDDAAGSSEFDAAFRREIHLIFKDKQLKVLTPDDPIYSFVYDERHIALAPLAQQLLPGVDIPRLEAIKEDGTPRVIYSPLSMSSGWEQLPQAYNKGYADQDALRLGVNVFTFVVSH